MDEQVRVMFKEPVKFPVPPPQKDRVLILSKILHFHGTQSPTGAVNNADIVLNTTEEPHQRRVRNGVGEEWQAIDFGDLTDLPVFAVAVENLEGMDLTVNPSAEQIAEAQAKVIEVGHPDDKIKNTVLAGCMGIFIVDHPELLQMRCRVGVAKCKISVFPK